MLLKIIRENINTGKKYKIGDFKEYIQSLKTDKVVIYNKGEPGIYSISKIKQLLINKGFYNLNHYSFEFQINNGMLTIEK